MKLEKYEKLKQRLEVLKLEKNFLPLNTTLYWFSFLGNIFLIYFGYFFIRTITDTLPELFPYQDEFFMVFIALFLTGYELTKRFVIDQTANSLVSPKRSISFGVVFGLIVSLLMILGSFYMSIKGAHRLVDNKDVITQQIDSTSNKKIEEIAQYYDKEISYYRSQPAKTRADREYRDSIVANLQIQKDQKIEAEETKTATRTESSLEENAENDFAFMVITFFLEIIVILGVGFNAYYTVSTFEETGKLLQTPKYKQYMNNLQLLKLYYANGKKESGEIAISYSKLMSLAKNSKLGITNSEIKDFVSMCIELGVTKETQNKRKQLVMSYDDAKKAFQKDDIF